jgi:hypothetical protein
VAYHILRHVYGNKLFAVVNRDVVPDHFGQDSAAPGPGSDNPFVARPVHPLDFFDEVIVGERSFFQRARHILSFCLSNLPD